MGIEQFEDLECWKKARELMNNIYKLTSKKGFKDSRLIDQMRFASIDIMSNITDGFDRKNHLEFIEFLYFSLKAISEVQIQLYVALDQKYVNQEAFQKNYDQILEVKKMIYGFVKYLKSR